ncbi:hypothetical protein FJT64_025289 [Amphibalanus amphitrite]|uniref:Telomeric repeat-binding factor 2-interacting protein 1 n=1 Tax=Amphibalanus amphitrite TaxID=1232801 RepID=A0A6A4W3Z8_AMPAM|nr:hypothetical protein FJT64_025289 [Amphibalanus amphitrite]
MISRSCDLVARVANLTATLLPLTEEQRRAFDKRERRRAVRMHVRLLAFVDTLCGRERQQPPDSADDSDTDAEDLVGVTDPGNKASRGAAAPVASADTPTEGTAPAADEAPLARATAAADTAAESAELDTGAGDASMEPAGASGAASVSPPERVVAAAASGAGRQGRGARRLYSQPLVPEVYPGRADSGRRRLRSASRSRSSVSSSDNFQPPTGKVTLPAGERSSRPGPSGVRPARRSRRLSSSADSGASADTPQSARSSRRLSSDAGADTTQSARRQWQAYSRPEEDVLVRRVLAEHAAGGLLGGRRLWERIQDSGVLPGRSWQSLKERWRRMAPRLRNNRRLTESQRRQLCRALRRPTGRPGGGRPPNEPHSPARPYTRAEDLAVLRFLREEPGRVVNIRGRALWQDMSVALNRSGRSVRSWQSLKERFHKRIAPALHHEYNEVDSVFRVFLAAELGL